MTAAMFLVVSLAFPTGGVCSTLVIVVLGYAAFSILATAIADAWRNVAPSRPKALEGRARLYRDVAARCLRAAERYPFAGDRLLTGYIDRASDEFFNPSGMEGRMLLNCPNCGGTVEEMVLDGDSAKCPYCESVLGA